MKLSGLWRCWVCLMLLSVGVQARVPNGTLADPALEARAAALDASLRCMVCQGQSLADSDAPLAHDIRILVRQRILAGDSDERIRAFLVDRYGDGVLMRPPLRSDTWLLWLGPGILLLIGGGMGVLFLRRGGKP